VTDKNVWVAVQTSANPKHTKNRAPETFLAFRDNELMLPQDVKKMQSLVGEDRVL
jgi:hypothetical protein